VRNPGLLLLAHREAVSFKDIFAAIWAVPFFLLADSPNLNLIERPWKFVKKEVLTCRYYEDFARFKAAITECLEGVKGKHKPSIKSLLTLNFQTFEEPQLLAG